MATAAGCLPSLLPSFLAASATEDSPGAKTIASSNSTLFITFAPRDNCRIRPRPPLRPSNKLLNPAGSDRFRCRSTIFELPKRPGQGGFSSNSMNEKRTHGNST